MGIRELMRFIEPCGVIAPYDDYRGQYVAIDAFQKIYKYCNSKENIQELDHKKVYNRHLKAIINCINQLLKFNITPIFIFDGSTIPTKIKNKEKMNEKLEQTKNMCATNTNMKRNIFKISPQQVKECEILLNNIGIPYLRAPFEADSQCAALTTNTTPMPVKTVITDDTDALVFGSHSILRMLPIYMIDNLRELIANFLSKCPNVEKTYSVNDIINVCGNIEEYYKKFKGRLNMDIKYKYDIIVKFGDMNNINFALCYRIDDILNHLKEKANKILANHGMRSINSFTVKNFVDMCILFGTDYLPRISNMCVNAIFERFIMSEMDTTKFVEGFDCIQSPDEYLENIEDVRDYYTNASVIEPSTIDMTIYKPSESDIYNQLIASGFSYSFVINNTKIYKNNFNNMLKNTI